MVQHKTDGKQYAYSMYVERDGMCNRVMECSILISWPLCDCVPGGVVRVQRTRACNSHWRWVAALSLRASTKQSMVFKKRSTCA